MDEIQTIFTLRIAITKVKGRRSIRFNYVSDGDYFKVIAPSNISDEEIINAAKRSIATLVKIKDRAAKKEEGFYLFGKKLEGIAKEEEESYLAGSLKQYLSRRVPVIAKEMGISFPFKVVVKDLKSVYGVNYFKKREVKFSTRLAHYSYRTIDSVIYHELCHFFYPNHQKGFHAMLDKYCPRYKDYRSALIRNDYEYAYSNDFILLK